MEPAAGQPVGQRFAHRAGRLAVLDLCEPDWPREEPCVRHAWSIGEREVKGVPDHWRRYRVVG